MSHEPGLASCGDRIVTRADGHVGDNLRVDDVTKAQNRARLFAGLAGEEIPEEPETDHPLAKPPEVKQPTA